jgi:hypothetical protein
MYWFSREMVIEKSGKGSGKVKEGVRERVRNSQESFNKRS